MFLDSFADDNLKEKKARQKEEGDAVSISTMAKMIKESMMVFWEFLHTDKDTTNLFLTIILQGRIAHLQDPADSDLFTEIKTIHQKVSFFHCFHSMKLHLHILTLLLVFYRRRGG